MQFVGRAGIDEETGRSIEDDGVGRIDISIEKIDDCFWGDSVGFISKDCIPIDSMENIDDSTLRDSVGFTFRDGISIKDIDGLWCWEKDEAMFCGFGGFE